MSTRGVLWPAAVLIAQLIAATAAAAEAPRRPSDRVAPVVQWQHDWLRGSVFYEVFVRSFMDSDADGAGDLRGLIERLDYLNDGDPTTGDDLGVTGLWLMPVFASPSYHGYDVIDYETVNPGYGTNEELLELLDEAHRRGMRVILDFVVNHTSSAHPWFVEAAASVATERRDWYCWSATNPGWTQPWGGSSPTWHRNAADGTYYYGVFWSGMPDLNYRHPAVLAEVERLASLWLAQGVDGFRLDAVRYLAEDGSGPGQQDTPETHALWRELSAHVRSVAPEAALVGEAWSTTPVIASYYGSTAQVAGGDELPLLFDFPLAEAILAGAGSGDAGAVVAVLEEVARRYPTGALDAPFLTNHDQVRLASRLGGRTGTMRVAASLLLTLPGVPFVYYGEELGLVNGSGNGDEAKRTPLPWDDTPSAGFTEGQPWYPLAAGHETVNVASELADPGSLLAHYRALIHLRALSPALGGGELRLLTPAVGVHPVLAFAREHPTETVLVAVNLSGLFVSDGPYDLPGLPTEELYGDGHPGPPGGSAGAWRVSLPPYATLVWRFE